MTHRLWNPVPGCRCARENGRVTDIPRSSIARTAKLVGLPLGHAGRAALGMGKRVGGRPAEVVAAELQARTAEQLFAVLGQLKGGAMKFGQALWSWRPRCRRSSPGRTARRSPDSRSPGHRWAGTGCTRSSARELGPRWATTKLVEFDDVPAAAASIGQVHKAVWRDGREVAVKIQYPGAGALMSDLNQLSRVARLAGSWVPGVDVKPIMDELKARMSEELDYHLEGRHQRYFAHAFRDDDDVLVPTSSSTPGTCSSRVDRRAALSRIITEGTQEERDEAATLYLESLLRPPTGPTLLHADPHPGNFRVTADGRLGVLDYGAVNRLPAGLPRIPGPGAHRGPRRGRRGAGGGAPSGGVHPPGCRDRPHLLLDSSPRSSTPSSTRSSRRRARGCGERRPRSRIRGDPSSSSGQARTSPPSTSSSTACGWGASGSSARSAERFRCARWSAPTFRASTSRGCPPPSLTRAARVTTTRSRACPRWSAGGCGCTVAGPHVPAVLDAAGPR